MKKTAPTVKSLSLDSNIPFERLGLNFETLAGLIMVGIWLTHVAQKENIIYSSKDPIMGLNNIYRTFSEWRHQIKQYAVKNKINSQVLWFGDNVPDLKGGAGYSFFDSKESQDLLSNIYKASREKLELLVQIQKEQSPKGYNNELRTGAKLKSYKKIKFDAKTCFIRFDKNEIKLPPYKNEYYLANVIFEYPVEKPIDWSEIYEGIHEKESENPKKDKKSLYDTVKRLNKRIQKKLVTNDDFILIQHKTVTRKY